MKLKNETNIFSALSNSIRIQIINHLENQNLTIAKLAKEMNSSIQANHNHIEKLLNAGLISKKIEGTLEVTTVGKLILKQIPLYSFLARNEDYFHDHDLRGIPEYLIQRIGELDNSKIISNPMQAFQEVKIFVEKSKKFIFGMSTMVPIEFFEVAQQKIKENVQIRLILPQKMDNIKGFSQKREKLGWISALKINIAEEKHVENLPITITITENAAHILFANKKTGLIDGKSTFMSEDPLFRKWCLDLFEYYWNTVPKVKETKWREII